MSSHLLNQGTISYPWIVVLGVSLAGALTDLNNRRIPNALTGPTLLTGFIWSVYTGGLTGLLEAVAACVVVALPFVLLFVFAGGGAGDAKLMGALGAWLGLWHGLVLLACVAIAGGLMGLGYAIWRRQLIVVLKTVLREFWQLLLRIKWRMPRSAENSGKIMEVSQEEATAAPQPLILPYGVAIFCGACIAATGVFIWNPFG